MGRPHDVIYEAMSEVVDRLQRDAGYDLRTATAAERRRFIDAFVSVIVREARKHGAPHGRGEPCVFSTRGPTRVSIAATRLLADRLRRQHPRAKSARLHRPDKPEMSEANQLQLTERPIEVALRRAGRLVPPHPSNRPWDQTPRGFAEAIQDALSESAQFAHEPWQQEVEPLPDWMSFPPATSKRVSQVGDRAMRNALFFYQVSRHLFSAVRDGTGQNEDEDKAKIDLAQRIRWRYIERLAPKVRQIGDIERRRWIEAELDLPPDTLKTPTS